MEIERKTRNPHRVNATIDMIHIISCLAIVVLAVVGFLNPRDNMKVFSAIFALASVLNFLNGIPRLKRSRDGSGRFVSGIFLCLVGVVLLGLAVLSMIP